MRVKIVSHTQINLVPENDAEEALMRLWYSEYNARYSGASYSGASSSSGPARLRFDSLGIMFTRKDEATHD